MKKVLLMFCFVVCVFKTDYLAAQNDRFFHSIGGAFEYIKTPGFAFNSTTSVNYNTVDVTRYGRFTVYGVNYHYNFRVNLFEMSKEQAIGLNIQPGLSSSILKVKVTKYPEDYSDGISDPSLGHISVPVYLSMEFGAGSTYQSTKDRGYVVGLGVQYFWGPVISDIPSDYASEVLRTSYMEPMIYLATRSWNSKNKMGEFGLRLGFAASGDYQAESTDPVEKASSFSVKLCWSRLLNY